MADIGQNIIFAGQTALAEGEEYGKV